jgi:hypothetical protein
VGVLLGSFFPLGLRLLEERSLLIQAWMWGLNGAFGVLGSVAAVILSMTLGIEGCLLLASGCYLLLVLPIGCLAPTPA